MASLALTPAQQTQLLCELEPLPDNHTLKVAVQVGLMPVTADLLALLRECAVSDADKWQALYRQAATLAMFGQ